jgi:chromosomal replication initiator protein
MTNQELWQRALAIIQLSVSAPIYNTWFSRTTCLEITDEHLLVGCPNTYVVNMLDSKFRRQIESAITQVANQTLSAHFIVTEEKPSTAPHAPLFDELPAVDTSEPSIPQPASPRRAEFQPSSLPEQPSQLNPHYTFEQFVVGGTNRVAHAAALAITDIPGKNYNPFFLYGGTGVGKTHLVQAIGNALIAKSPRTKVLYCSIERFMNDFIDSIRFKTTNEFKKRYRSADVLIVDDIQFIGNKESTQEEFFHTFNELHASGRQIILCSDRPPREIASLADRLTSRFEGGLSVDIAPPDFETRSAIIRAKADRLGLNLASEVADYVASIPTENIRSLEGVMLKLQSYAFSTREPLTLQTIQMLLGTQPTGPSATPRRANPNEVIKRICETYGVTLKELSSKKRTQNLVLPRQMAMYVLRQDLELNLETIGNLLGGRDHTTVMHGIDKMSRLVANDTQTRSTLTALRQDVLK